MASPFGKKFLGFCNALRIESKEQGLVPLRMLGTQRYLVERIAAAWERDVHHFVVLKGRQQGITTIFLALDIFWPMANPGLHGSVISHTEEMRDDAKATITNYLKGLPPAWRLPIRQHNRNQLVFANRSRLSYQIAGTRKKGGLGRGKGLAYLHATECSSWADQDGLASLSASLAQMNPLRLFGFESTARGFNEFNAMWEQAKGAHTQEAIFIGWWRDERNRVARGSRVHDVYWDGLITGEEREWVSEVKTVYGYDIDDEQLAWWRLQAAENYADLRLLYQEFPPTENYAFIMTGARWFPLDTLNKLRRLAVGSSFESHRYLIGSSASDCAIHKTTPENAELKIFRPYEPGGVYAIGADPAYGSNDWKDAYCLQVLRCYADGVEQVAEYRSTDCKTYGFAWIICHLAGYYRGATLCLEITGPGQSVMQEITRLQNSGEVRTNSQGEVSIFQFAANVQHYLYRRPDSMGGMSAYHWQSTQNTKLRMMSDMRDILARDMADIHSVELIEECNKVEIEDGSIGAPGREKDDRVIAFGLALRAWLDMLHPQLSANMITKKRITLERQSQGASRNAVTEGVQMFLKHRVGIDPALH